MKVSLTSWFAIAAALWGFAAPSQAAGQGEPAVSSSGSDVDRQTKQIYDNNLPPIGQTSQPIGTEAWATEGLDVVDRRGAEVAKEARFMRHDGTSISIGSLLGGPPVLLMLNYSRCPMLCGRQQRYIAEGLRDITLEPGTEYRFVSVSIDPVESPETAADTRENFLEAAQLARSVDGVEFLVGDKGEIDKLAESVGFEYRYVPEQNEYAHAAVMTVVTPDGTISRYLNGFYGPDGDFNAQTLRLSIVEASEGKVSSFVDNVLLYCFLYDNVQGKYSARVWRIMQVAAGLFAVVLLLFLVPVWLKAGWGRGNEDGLSFETSGSSDGDDNPPATA